MNNLLTQFKYSLIVFVCLSCLVLNSCNIVSSSGPSSLNNLNYSQLVGKKSPNEYVIIDIQKSNIADYNKVQNTKRGVLPKNHDSKLYTDLIRAYDKLKVGVVDTADAGAFGNSKGPIVFGPLEVPMSGVINIPYAGKFNVIGKSISAVHKEISDKYANVFNTAEVTLSRVGRLNLRANLIGLANKPGQYSIVRRGMTLADLVALGGGTRETPYLCEYWLHRNKRNYILNNHQVTNLKILVQDEDLLEIKRSEQHSVTVMGAVNRPGNYKFSKSNYLLSDLLGESGGLNVNLADATGLFVFRNTMQKSHVYRFNLKKPEGLINASKFNLHGKDIIYVTEAPLSRWGRVIRMFLPFSQLQRFSNFGN